MFPSIKPECSSPNGANYVAIFLVEVELDLYGTWTEFPELINEHRKCFPELIKSWTSIDRTHKLHPRYGTWKEF